MPGLGLKGTLKGGVSIEGPLSCPVGRASLESSDFTMSGEHYGEARIEADVGQGAVTVKKAVLRRAAGGSLQATGTVGLDGALALNVRADRFPLQAMPKVRELPTALAGFISGDLFVGGDVNHPTLGGMLSLIGMRLRNTLIGNGTLRLEPGGDAVRLRGSFFEHMEVDGHLTLSPKSALFARITLRKLPLEILVPELFQLDTRGIVSGTVELSVTTEGLKAAQIRLSELSLTTEWGKQGEDDHGRIELRAEPPVILAFADGKLTMERLRIASSQGVLDVQGSIDATSPNIAVRGSIGVDLLRYFDRPRWDRVQGALSMALTLGGTWKQPKLQGTLSSAKLELTPKESDSPLELRDLLIELETSTARLTRLRLLLDDTPLDLWGTVTLSGTHPTALDLRMAGHTSARLLGIFAPRYFSEASGRVALEGSIRGTLPSAVLAVTLAPVSAASSQGVELLPRGLGREITLRSGSLQLSGPLTQIEGTARSLSGTLDSGDFKLDGYFVLSNFELSDMDLHFQGLGIPHRSPRVYEVSVNADVHASLTPCRRASLGNSCVLMSGTLDLVEGRYVQRFDLLKDVIRPARVHVESKPFWQGIRLLEEMDLALQVRTAGPVFVRNNIAEIALDVSLNVGGTLQDPRLAGDIRATEGTFSLPFLRGTFQVQEGGTISFDPSKEIPRETPWVRLGGETVYVDNREQEHQITLTLDGPLGQLSFDLQSNTGLGKNQCLALLSTGRTTEEVRAMVTGRSEPGAQQTPAAAAADQALKTLTSDFMSLLVEDPLKKVLRLDLARLEFGTESIELRLGWRFGRHVRVVGTHELGLLGDSHTEGRAELKISDHLLLVPQLERLVRGQQTEQETVLRAKTQLKLRVFLR